MTKLSTYAAIAAALMAAAAPGLASAQTTGTRIQPHDMGEVRVIGAITDGTEARGEDPADAAIAELPAVYEDAAPAAEEAAQPAVSK